MDGRLLWLLVVLCASNCISAALTVANVLGDNMVLQRDVEAQIWGWDSPTYKLTITIGTEKYLATADDNGLWKASIAPKAAGGPYNITIEDEADSVVTLTNILFGDVWVCSGQSNMAFPLSWAFNSSEEIAATPNFPNIRVFISGSNISSTPLTQLDYVGVAWSVPSPSFMGTFSAVCWFHARDLYQANGVPLGLIESAWGGTIIEAWSSPTALAACPTKDAPQGDEVAVNPNQNSVLWNAMIYPFTPMSIFGVLWYQGEQNTYEPTIYGCREMALITDWRNNFNTNFMFNFVQLAPWSGNENSNVGTDIPETREAQLEGLRLPRVGFATAVDLGDSTSPYNDIHPRYKQQVGARLATTTLAVAFDENLPWMPPQLLTVTLASTTPNISLTVSVENFGAGLYYVDNTCPSNVAPSNCSNFEIVLSDGKSYSVTGMVNGAGTVEVTLENPNKLTPTTLYYGYSSWPVLTLFRKGDGYPLLPFAISTK